MSKIIYVGQYALTLDQNPTGKGWDGNPRQNCFFWLDETHRRNTLVKKNSTEWFSSDGNLIRDIMTTNVYFAGTGKLEFIYE